MQQVLAKTDICSEADCLILSDQIVEHGARCCGVTCVIAQRLLSEWTSTMRRYFFVSGDEKVASGGRAVIYEIAATLRKNGFDAYVLHGSPNGRYPGGRTDVPLCYSTRIPKSLLQQFPRLKRLQLAGNVLVQSLSKGPNDKVTFRPTDVIVLPERALAAGIKAFPDHPKVLLSQNPFAYSKARAYAYELGYDPDHQMFWNIGTAISCIDRLRLTGAERMSYIKVQPNLTAFPFAEKKKKLITYMPRKRPAEATMIVDALQRRGKITDYDLVAIDKMPQTKVAELLANSLIFISLMRTEALGFPGMEAMAAGAIVIGYTGFGAREYFDEKTGIPVIEGHTSRVVEAVEQTAEEYARAPERLDTLRASASQFIHTQYGHDQFLQDVRNTFTEIDNALGPA